MSGAAKRVRRAYLQGRNRPVVRVYDEQRTALLTQPRYHASVGLEPAASILLYQHAVCSARIDLRVGFEMKGSSQMIRHSPVSRSDELNAEHLRLEAERDAVR